MKNSCLAFLFVFLFSIKMSAQTADELREFNKQRYKIQKKGMAVLGVWAVGNIATGIVGYNTSEGQAAQFHKMNAIWNVINLGLAVPGYIGAARGKTDLSFRETFKQQLGTEKTFLFNAALDAGYMAGGLYLYQRSKTESSQSRQDMMEGYGNSIILQGGFLMAFDTAMYLIQRSHNNKKLMPYLDKITIGYQGVGFRHSF